MNKKLLIKILLLATCMEYCNVAFCTPPKPRPKKPSSAAKITQLVALSPQELQKIKLDWKEQKRNTERNIMKEKLLNAAKQRQLIDPTITDSELRTLAGMYNLNISVRDDYITIINKDNGAEYILKTKNMKELFSYLIVIKLGLTNPGEINEKQIETVRCQVNEKIIENLKTQKQIDEYVNENLIEIYLELMKADTRCFLMLGGGNYERSLLNLPQSTHAPIGNELFINALNDMGVIPSPDSIAILRNEVIKTLRAYSENQDLINGLKEYITTLSFFNEKHADRSNKMSFFQLIGEYLLDETAQISFSKNAYVSSNFDQYLDCFGHYHLHDETELTVAEDFACVSFLKYKLNKANLRNKILALEALALAKEEARIVRLLNSAFKFHDVAITKKQKIDEKENEFTESNPELLDQLSAIILQQKKDVR